MKKIILILTFFVVTGFSALFAQDRESTWAKSYDKDGQLNIYGSVGFGLNPIGLGFGASVGGEYILTNFKIGDVSFPFGVGVRAAFDTFNYSYGALGSGTWLDWGIGPLATLHLGLRNAPIEFYISAGLAVTGHSYSIDSYSDNFAGVGFLTIDGVVFHVTDTFGVLLEFGYVGNASVFGVGVKVGL